MSDERCDDSLGAFAAVDDETAFGKSMHADAGAQPAAGAAG